MKRFVTPFLLCLALLAWLIVPGLAVGSPESLPVTELNSKFIRAESDPWPASPAAVWGESWAYASARINDGEYWETVGSLWLLPTGQGESTLIDSCPWPMVWSDVEAPINSPDMADGTLVWSEKRDSGGDYDIYGYDMASETLFPVCTAAGDQTSPRVSGDLVVWVDDRDASTSRDIYGFDLNAKAEFPICRHPSQQTDPDVSGTTVVWADARQGDGDVYAATVDLARRTASEFVVFSHAGAQAQPGIAGSQVVWADARDAETHIYGKDLQGGGVQLLSGLAGEQIEPIVSDGTVLWFQNDVQYSDDYRLDGLNLGTGESFTTAVEINNPIHPYLYAIDGPRFSWGFGERHGAMVHLCEFDWQSSVTIADGKAWVTSPVLPLALSAKTAWNVVTNMRFSYDSVHWTSFRPYVPATSFALPPADGMRSVFVQFRGDDGRLSPVVTDEVGLDAVPPLTADDADDAWHASDVTVRLQSVDATSGVAGTEYRIDGGSLDGRHRGDRPGAHRSLLRRRAQDRLPVDRCRRQRRERAQLHRQDRHHAADDQRQRRRRLAQRRLRARADAIRRPLRRAEDRVPRRRRRLAERRHAEHRQRRRARGHLPLHRQRRQRRGGPLRDGQDRHRRFGDYAERRRRRLAPVPGHGELRRQRRHLRRGEDRVPTGRRKLDDRAPRSPS